MKKTCCTLYVDGMHCVSCELFLREELCGKEGVEEVVVDRARNALELTGEFDCDACVLAERLSPLVAHRGYRFSVHPPRSQMREFFIALPIALSLVLLFFLVQDAPFFSGLLAGGMTYAGVFTLGIIASLSSCLAVVGSVALSLGLHFARTGRSFLGLGVFHIGRLVGFFVLGGVLALLGSVIQIGVWGTLILSTVVAGVMLLLGLQLLDIPFLRGRAFRLPAKFSFLARIHPSTFLGAFLLGAGTFFLPCGFTQSVQIYVLTTGNFLTGAFTMLLFALGTFPILALVSFGSWSFAKRTWRGVFFKVSGLLILALALYQLSTLIPLFFT